MWEAIVSAELVDLLPDASSNSRRTIGPLEQKLQRFVLLSLSHIHAVYVRVIKRISYLMRPNSQILPSRMKKLG